MRGHLAELARENWEGCAGLAVGDDRGDFVGTNLLCIAGSRFGPGRQPLAVHRGSTMVGTAVLEVGSDGTAVIEHLTIDARFQGEGLGRAALQAVVGRARSFGARGTKPRHHPGNPVAELYGSAGFGHTGEERGGGEPAMALSLKS